jgi:hypothetical protein
METFEIKQLFSVVGESGLFKLVNFLDKINSAKLENLVDPNKTVVAKRERLAKLDNIVIYTTTGKVSLESVLDTMMTISETEPLPDFSELSNEDKEKWMEKIVPGYDKLQFKPYHMVKIFKWYAEIDKALTILNANTEDPYEKLKTDESSSSATAESGS